VIASVAALLVEPERWRLAIAPFAAAVLTRITYPAPGYQTGLSSALTAVLVVRNVLLITGLAWLAVSTARAPPLRGNRPVVS
jgi:hypothetical protein